MKWLTFLGILLVSWPALGSERQLSPQTFDQDYSEIQYEYQTLVNELGTSIVPKKRDRSHSRINKKKVIGFKKLKEIKKIKQDFDYVADLRENLLAIHEQEKKMSSNPINIKKEATLIAVSTLEKIYELRKKYKSFMMPLVHNMMIDVGIKKRGACKHWAEDLLNHLKTVPRKHFQIAWGEANPKKFSEHNVAVIFPNSGNFKNGLVIDPWRTAGRPFWIKIKDDKNYKWQHWQYFGVH